MEKWAPFRGNFPLLGTKQDGVWEEAPAFRGKAGWGCGGTLGAISLFWGQGRTGMWRHILGAIPLFWGSSQTLRRARDNPSSVPTPWTGQGGHRGHIRAPACGSMGIKPNTPMAERGSPNPNPNPKIQTPLTHHMNHLLPAAGAEQRVRGESGAEEQQQQSRGASGPGALGTHLGGTAEP